MKRLAFLFALYASTFLGHQAIGVKTEGRIVGGKDANEGQFPYAASVQINGKHCCGGSIIDPRWILTAAHCVVSSPGSVEKPTALRVMVGSVLLSKATTYYNVSKVVPHSKFIFNLLKADIALLQLEEEILFSRNVQKIELELDGVIKETPIVCGWGILDRKGTLPDRLQFLQTEIIPHSRCNRLLEEEDIMRADSSQICDLSSEYGQTSKGDSGGPLVVDDKQIGLVSYGEYGRDIPAVNTNVSYFYDWIQEHISGNSYKFKLDERYYFS